MVYPSILILLPLPRLPVVDWTDAPTDLNGLVRFVERRNLVSARVPSRFKRSLGPVYPCAFFSNMSYCNWNFVGNSAHTVTFTAGCAKGDQCVTYRTFSNLIRTSFCRFLTRKNKVSSRFQSAPFLQPPLAYKLDVRAETERDGTRAETRFGFPAKRTSPFKSAGVSVQSAAGRRGVRISGSNAG